MPWMRWTPSPPWQVGWVDTLGRMVSMHICERHPVHAWRLVYRDRTAMPLGRVRCRAWLSQGLPGARCAVRAALPDLAEHAEKEASAGTGGAAAEHPNSAGMAEANGAVEAEVEPAVPEKAAAAAAEAVQARQVDAWLDELRARHR